MKRKSTPGTLIIVVSLIIVTIGISEAGFEDRTFENQRLDLARKSENILIENGVCSSIKDCRNKKLIFISPAKSGINVKTYSISSKAALQQLTSQCAKAFLDANGAINITIEMFSISKDEELKRHFWQASHPSMTVEFKGDK
ncbi:hypothetical protein [Sulfuritortus calidifontis]|uniref:hypothetical protein n=1 Tax=Sulfuritortus calidifontis TaxID=1914471 RepID=UPI000F83677D|nr:hypothetical protein [Sulfuritortus calidifontis]